MNAKCCAYDTYAKGFPKLSLSPCVCLLAFNNTGQEFPKRKEDVSWVELIINHCRAEAEKAR